MPWSFWSRNAFNCSTYQGNRNTKSIRGDCFQYIIVVVQRFCKVGGVCQYCRLPYCMVCNESVAGRFYIQDQYKLVDFYCCGFCRVDSGLAYNQYPGLQGFNSQPGEK